MTPTQREDLRGRSLQLAHDVLGLDVPANGQHVACPIHGGVSFHFDRNRQRFHCFGCSPQYDGDVVDLAMKLLGVSLPEAERLLSDGRKSAPMPRKVAASVPQPPGPILSEQQPPEGQVIIATAHGDDYQSSACVGRRMPWPEYAAAQTAEPMRLAVTMAEYGDGRDTLPLKSSAGWDVPAVLAGATRGKAHVQAVSMLWLDADHATPRLKADAYAGRGLFKRARIVRPTCSSRPGRDKLRIEFPLRQWLTGEAAREATLELMALVEDEYGGEVAAIWGETGKHGKPIALLDEKAATVSQCSFSPVLCSDAPREAQWFDGVATDGAKLAEMWRERTASAPVEAAGATQTPESAVDGPREEDDDGGRRSQADVIAEFGKDMVLFVDSGDKSAVYADITVDGHRETVRVDSTPMREYLRAAYYARFKKTVRGESLAQAIESLRAQARYGGGGLSYPVGLRCAQQGGTILVDLANKDWQVVEVTETGWRVSSTPAVRMRRAALGELPIPTAGNIETLREFVNLKTDDDFVLLVTFMLAALRGCAPFPVLVPLGEQGTGKSTLCRIIKRLCDPSESPLRSLPSNVQDLLIAAQGQHIVVFDNVSHLQPWLSDGLCRLSDGAGIGQRTLYTNDEETVLSAARPVVLNGISDFVTRGDLADRSIAITLETIPEDAREDASLFWERFDKACPAIIAALLDGVARGLQTLPLIRTRGNLPRMAGFARWGMACEGAYWPKGTFEAAYTRNRETASAASLEDDAFVEAMRAWADADVLPWSGRPKDLLAAVTATVETRPKDWPNRSQAVVGIIRRNAPALRRTGLDVAITKRSGRTHVELRQRPKHQQEAVVPVVPVDSPKTHRNSDSLTTVSDRHQQPEGSLGLSLKPEQQQAHDSHDSRDRHLRVTPPFANERGFDSETDDGEGF